MLLILSADFFQIYFFKKTFQYNYQSVKKFESRSGQRFCQSLSGSKLLAKFISRRQKSPLARKALSIKISYAGRPWVKVLNFQNPELSKFKLLNRQYANKIIAISHLIDQLS